MPMYIVEEQACDSVMSQGVVKSNISGHLAHLPPSLDNWLICWLNAFVIHLHNIAWLDIPLVIR